MFGFKIDEAAKYVALVSASLYAAGFLIVNSNLAKYGDFDPDFASSRYVFAGFLFVWYIVPVSYIVLKHIYDSRNKKEAIAVIRNHDKFVYYSILSDTFILSPINRICSCAILFGSSSLASVKWYNFNNYVQIFALLFMLLVFKASQKVSIRTHFILTWALQILLFIVFIYSVDELVKIVALTYILPVFFFIVLLKPMAEPIKTIDAKFEILYFGVISFTVLLMFGGILYGLVKHEFGGGQPVSVTVYTKTDVGMSELTKTASGGFSMSMIALNDKKLIGISGGKLVLINADNISSVIYQ